MDQFLNVLVFVVAEPRGVENHQTVEFALGECHDQAESEGVVKA